MAVSLCDALGLMGDPASSSELLHCMELPHRRLAVEAAAALARLGNEAGTSRLIELAAEPSARLRVLAYGEELGIEEQIDEVYRCAVSIAEAELVTYLADPSQFGIPPNRCELLDSRTLYWPGYEEPRNCYLFRFRYLYQLPDGKEAEYENIGIAGPLAHAFKADMCQLNIDDVYAAFAGWQAEHDEIRELRWTDMDRDQLRHADRVLAQLSEDGYEHWQSQSVGLFFGTLVFVGRANRDGQDGVVVVDDRDTMWFPQSGSPRDIGPAEGYCVYKGQRMLAEFNG